MRSLIGLIGAAVVFGAVPSLAAAPPSPEEVVKRAQEGFRKTKDPKGIESIKAWCKDTLAAFSFPERDKLMTQALKLMEANKLDEANALLKRANSLEELDTNLGNLVCKPK
jgi:hypothetical protein